jgi:hypothetical protein
MGSKLHEVFNTLSQHYGWRYRCPGCQDMHLLSGWTFNGDLENPTFTPSVLAYPHEKLTDDDKTVIKAPRCHHFVTAGRIHYLSDCTHALKGQTVDMSDW